MYPIIPVEADIQEVASVIPAEAGGPQASPKHGRGSRPSLRASLEETSPDHKRDAARETFPEATGMT